MEVRSIWHAAQFATMTTSSQRAFCTPFTLPSGGVLTLDSSSVVTLAADAVFKPQCTGAIDTQLADVTPGGLRDPFYTSTIPQCYALAATTVIAYMLVIMLFITPRQFLSGGILVLGRRGFTNEPSGSDAGIGIGGRPWLQKVAALTVAISLTIATANTFRVAQYQYEVGVMDGLALQTQVLLGTELKVIRVISDTFLWLAQAQTLIRLFPRQKEKIIIKWTAFALISLNLIFSILNSFVYVSSTPTRPYNITEAIPAVSYLFHLALGLLYGAWVIYYGFTKKNYAFYHPQMRNICLVALMSIVSVIVPVVFFVLDISKPDVAGWGDYVRWVGAAAASVVVWEWVERIEALERNDKKDGVLGREVFDGDEMLDISLPSNRSRPGGLDRDGGGRNDGGFSTGATGPSWPSRRHRAGDANAQPSHNRPLDRLQRHHTHAGLTTHQLPRWPMRPPPAATPVSRADTGSAESTVYAVRYHPIGESREPVFDRPVPQPTPPRRTSVDLEAQHDVVLPDASASDTTDSEKSSAARKVEELEYVPDNAQAIRWDTPNRWNPFRRKAQDPPREIAQHTAPPPSVSPSAHRRDIIGRLEDFASVQAEKLREKTRPTHDHTSLPVTRIPAPPRRRNLQGILEELDAGEAVASPSPADGTAPVAGDSSAVPTADPPVDETRLSPVLQRNPTQRSDDRPNIVRASSYWDDTASRTPSSPYLTRQSPPFPLGSSPPPGQSTNPAGLPVVRIPPPRRTRSDGPQD
jgi:hypothetical protein